MAENKESQSAGSGGKGKVSSRQLIIALDYSDPGQAWKLVDQLSPLGVGFKVGLELFLAGGKPLVSELSARCPLFLDLKFHDIPNTVAAAVRSAAELKVWMLNVHAAGGRKMLTAARAALENLKHKPLLLAVTVLTSMDDRELAETGCSEKAADRVVRLARLSFECGLDGIVCSPLEIEAVKKNLSEKFITVSPGVRAPGEEAGDQSRVATPGQVIKAGGNFLVVGRPVTRARDPLEAARKILVDMRAGGRERSKRYE